MDIGLLLVILVGFIAVFALFMFTFRNQNKIKPKQDTSKEPAIIKAKDYDPSYTPTPDPQPKPEPKPEPKPDPQPKPDPES